MLLNFSLIGNRYIQGLVFSAHFNDNMILSFLTTS